MNTQVVNFSNHELRVIENQAQKWFCARDIAKALEFKNPDADVCNVYRRNKSEFDETMTCTCKLQVQGQTKTVRLYNREGAWLIGMFARTPKAAEFRKWVLKVLGGRGGWTVGQAGYRFRAYPIAAFRQKGDCPFGKGQGRNRRDCEKLCSVCSERRIGGDSVRLRKDRILGSERSRFALSTIPLACYQKQKRYIGVSEIACGE